MNWDYRLSRAESSGEFQLDDIVSSEHWCSCAVGKSATFWVNPVFGPDDSELKFLGYIFMNDVRNGNIISAIDTYQLILDRITVLEKFLSGGGA